MEHNQTKYTDYLGINITEVQEECVKDFNLKLSAESLMALIDRIKHIPTDMPKTSDSYLSEAIIPNAHLISTARDTIASFSKIAKITFSNHHPKPTKNSSSYEKALFEKNDDSIKDITSDVDGIIIKLQNIIAGLESFVRAIDDFDRGIREKAIPIAIIASALSLAEDNPREAALYNRISRVYKEITINEEISYETVSVFREACQEAILQSHEVIHVHIPRLHLKILNALL